MSTFRMGWECQGSTFATLHTTPGADRSVPRTTTPTELKNIVSLGTDGLKGLFRRNSRPWSEPVLLNLIKKSSITDLEVLGRAPAIPPECFECALDRLRLRAVLHITHHRPYPSAGCDAVDGVLIPFGRCGNLCFQFTSRSLGIPHDHGSCDEIFELSKVSSPVVKKRSIHQGGRENQPATLPHFIWCAANKLLNQVWNFLAALAKRRNFNGEYAKTVKEVFPERSFQQSIFDFYVRGGKYPYVDFGRFLTPSRANCPS